MCENKRTEGFTLAELLIVVAIIGVLVAVSIPIFSSQLTKAKIATDQANVRSAKAAAIAEYLTTGTTQDVTYYYNAATGRVQTDASDIVGYGKYTGSDKAVEIGATGTPNNNGKANFVLVTMSVNGVKSIKWSGGLMRSNIEGIAINSDTWWNDSQERQESFETLMTTENSVRKKADIEILNSLAGYFEGMTAEEAKKILGEKRFELTKRGTMFFSYGQDGGGSIRVAGMDTDYQPFLQDIGFDAKIYTTNGEWRKVDSYGQGYNYTNQYLFSSNEMLGEKYKSGIFHNIDIKFDIVDGFVKNAYVWVDGLEKEGYKSS